MDIRKILPKNSVFLVTVLFLGLIIIGILTFFYTSFIPAKTSSNSVDSGVTGEAGRGNVLDYVIDKDDSAPPYSGDGSSAKKDEDQKVVKTGSLKVKVDDFDKADQDVRTLTKQSGGFVAYSSDTGEGRDRSLVLTVKVPAALFDSFIAELKTYGKEVVSFSENSDDVTRVYTDLQARLKNQKAVETRLVSILAQAANVTEILEVEKELGMVRQNIEQLQSQVNYYDSQIDMSSVTISMILNPESLDVAGDEWQPVGVFKEAVKALVGLVKGLGTLAIWLGVFSPVYLVGYLLFKLAARKITK